MWCARQWTRSLADAEDAVQEAFVGYWRRQRELPGEPMALLVTSVRRAADDLARRRGCRRHSDADPINPARGRRESGGDNLVGSRPLEKRGGDE